MYKRQEEKILACRGGLPSDELLISAKKDGFSDKYLSQRLEISEDAVRSRRIALGLEELSLIHIWTISASCTFPGSKF